MKVTSETVATREVQLTVEPDDQTVRRALRKAARAISRYRPISGYRPGKAPYALVERMYGHDVILNEALNDLGNDVYRKALEDQEIEPYSPGEMDITSQDPLVLSFRVPLMPEVTLGDYATVKVEPEPEVALTEEQIDEQVDMVQRRHAEYTPVEDRPVAVGDQVIASISGESEGETVVNRQNSTLDINDALMPPGFAEALVGMETEDTREFSLAYPGDYEDENLAGKNVDFTVTVSTIRTVELPAMDDDLAKMAGDFETFDELRDALAESLKARLEGEARSREAQAAVEALVEICEVEYPEAMVQEQLDQAVRNQAGQLAQMGFTWDRYLEMIGKTEDEVRSEMREGVEQDITRRLCISEFAQLEKVDVQQEELSAEMNAMARQLYATYGERASEMLETMSNSGAMMSIYGDVLTRKATVRLANMATGRPVDEHSEEDDDQDADDTSENDDAQDSDPAEPTEEDGTEE